MLKKRFRTFLFFLSLISISVLEIAFSSPQENFLTVEGRAMYSQKDYGDQRVNVNVTEDGKAFKTLKADERGIFRVKVDFNHVYMFSLSMDYHGTSKVLVDTKVPQRVIDNGAGGVIDFRCELFELFDGLNTGLLNRPLMKVRYIEEKNRFEFDEEYSENMQYELDGFLDRIEMLKLNRAKVLKEEQKRNAQAAKEDKKKDRKVIALEEEELKISANKRGSKNVMDLPRADEDDALKKEVKVVKVVPIVTTKPKEKPVEVIEIVEEEDENQLNIVPKRISIAMVENGSEEVDADLLNEKNRTQEDLEKRRMEEEARIRERVKSYNREMILKREKRLASRKIQTEMLNSLLKTIALAEIGFKMEDYKLNPITYKGSMPSIVVQSKTSLWKDEEKIMVRYPNSKMVFRKETYPFGITYYYMGDKEIDKKTYCTNINDFSKHQYSCTN